MIDLVKYGFSAREVEPQGTGANGVLLLGEGPGGEEDAAGIPFAPWAQSGSVLERAIMRIGARRDQFVLTNTVPFRPPNNWLEGAPYCAEAIEGCRHILEQTLERFKPRVIVALGGIATRATTGLVGEKLGVSNLTGYLLPSRYGPVIPCFHPAFLRRGKMGLLGVMMRCLKLATLVARDGLKPVEPPLASPPPGYILNPTEAQAVKFAKNVLKNEVDNIAHVRLAYDIETPYSTEEDSAEEAEGEQVIRSIQFSGGAGSGIYFPWREPYIDVAKRLLSSDIPKLGWNVWRFDDPILRANGCHIGGESHDLMWTWHHLQPDLPRGLQFAAGQQGWPWPWKHLDHQAPAFYGIVDVDVLHFLAGD